MLGTFVKAFLRQKLDRVGYVWGSGNIWKSNTISHWLQHPVIQAHIESRITGGDGNRFEYFLKNYLEGKLPVERALSIGCGFGELERGLCKYNFARRHDGFDFAAQAINEARIKAEKHGMHQLHYDVGDANVIKLSPGQYDVVFGVSSIHHVQRLEHLFDQVAQSLKPGGYFFLDEYVGPSQFQWTDTQLRVMNEQLSLLPLELKRCLSDRKNFKRRVERKTIAYMNEADPSEAVRSQEILPLLKRYFKVLEVRGYGGSLLHELLYDIAGNFRKEQPESLEHLKRLVRVEDELLKCGELDHDFAVIVAQREQPCDPGSSLRPTQ